MDFKMKKTNIIIIITILLTGAFLFIKEQHINNIKETCTGNDVESVSICIQQGRIFPQEQYDLFYNLAINNSTESLISDNHYYEGFNLAHYNCKIRENDCVIHDPEIFQKFKKDCAINANDINSGCIEDYFVKAQSNSENIAIFIEIMEKAKNRGLPLDCSLPLDKFYNNLSDDLKKEIPSDIQKICSK